MTAHTRTHTHLADADNITMTWCDYATSTRSPVSRWSNLPPQSGSVRLAPARLGPAADAIAVCRRLKGKQCPAGRRAAHLIYERTDCH